MIVSILYNTIYYILVMQYPHLRKPCLVSLQVSVHQHRPTSASTSELAVKVGSLGIGQPSDVMAYGSYGEASQPTSYWSYPGNKHRETEASYCGAWRSSDSSRWLSDSCLGITNHGGPNKWATSQVSYTVPGGLEPVVSLDRVTFEI